MNYSQSYIVLDDVVPVGLASELARFVHEERNWKLHEEWFFSQNDTAWIRRNYGRPPVGESLPAITCLVNRGISLIESEMNAVVGNHYTVIGHMMMPGQLVGIHNDSPEQDRGRLENFRFIYYVDDEFEDNKGGHLFIFNSRNESDVLEAVRPLFNSGVLIQLSDGSFHAVGRVRQGVRYSIVVSYWGYPILFTAQSDVSRIRNCLRTLISRGLEEVVIATPPLHIITTTLFASFLSGRRSYICLAGLMHSIMGRVHSGVRPSLMNPDEVRELVGTRTYQLLTLLRVKSGFDPGAGLSNQIVTDLYLIELANLVEQAETFEQFDELTTRFNSSPYFQGINRTTITRTLERLRQSLKSGPAGGQV